MRLLLYPALFVTILVLSVHRALAQYDWPENRESGLADGGATMRRTYRLEDFLWTGSGDGEVEPSPQPFGPGALAFTTTTVYKTTTATTTILATPTPLYTTSLIITQVLRSPTGPINPTASFPWSGGVAVPSTAAPSPPPSWTLLNGDGPQDPDEAHDDSLPDPRFWLVTVLKANDTQDWHLATDLLESRLSRLYKAAFLRQQERHLGIVNASALAALGRLRRASDVVRVTVHNVTTLVAGRPGPAAARLLYWVRVRGRPVPAATAAYDMRLISDHEMAAELGLPIITKAEPYLHAPVPLAARGRGKDVWLLVGAAGCGLLLLLLVLAVTAAALSHRSKAARRVTGSATTSSAGPEQRRGHGAANRRRHFHGRDNKAFQHDEHTHKRDKSSPGFLGVAAPSIGGRRGGGGGSGLSGSASGSGSSFSCASSCSGTGSASGSASSSDVALVRRRGHHGIHHHPGHHVHQHGIHHGGRHGLHQTVHHAVNPALVDALHLVDDDVVVSHPRGPSGDLKPAVPLGNRVHDLDALDVLDAGTSPRVPARRASPNSYLSMPSVKQFPRGAALPEPLTRVLEPAGSGRFDGEDSVERVTVSPAPGAVLRPIIRPAPPRQAATAPVRAPPAVAAGAASKAPVRPEDVPRAACAVRPSPEPMRSGVRHQSLEGDPGVLGPVVWGLRCQRLTEPSGASGAVLGAEAGPTSTPDAVSSPPQAGRMRRRFHELLDDAFSLFAGSRSASRTASQGSQDEDDSSASSPPPPVPPVASMQLSSVLDDVLPVPPPDHRVQSAVQRPVAGPPGEAAPRPKTSATLALHARRPSTASANGTPTGASRPRGAWGSDQAVARPLSAGPFHRPQLPDGQHGASSPAPSCLTPRIDTAVILSDARLPPHDPAVPLIAAIKHELSKFSAVPVPVAGARSATTPLPGYTPSKE